MAIFVQLLPSLLRSTFLFDNLLAQIVIQLPEMIVKSLEHVDTMCQVDNAHDFTARMHGELGHFAKVRKEIRLW